jgi:Zn finger protein HypA/HybF involved in hydrogenase expression
MPVELECESCGLRHTMRDRVFDPDEKRMVCPECGSYPFSVHRIGITWHPPSDGQP